MRELLALAAVPAVLCPLVAASPFPPKPTGVTTVNTNDTYGSWLSYKETHICETTPGVKAYAGYIHLPAQLTGESFDINTFYWFFEARKNPETAPLTMYLAGGPGDPSMNAVFGENGGPCNINDDYNSTVLNPWSWNGESNMLYIDQPVQTGFSYDTLTNATLDLFTRTYTPSDFSEGIPETNATFLVGTVASQSMQNMTMGSVRGASALWHFMQIWTAHFPKCATSNKKLNLWTNSWGGFYSTQTFSYFERQNDKVRSGELKNSHLLNLDTLGITNGCIDPLVEGPQYPELAINNTYGFKAYSEEVYHEAMNNITKPGGCTDIAAQCHELAAIGDPDYQGTNDTVNEACGLAFGYCFEYVQGAYLAFGKGRSAYDMSHQVLDPFPLYRQAYFLNQAWVQSELGVPVNYTAESTVAGEVYTVGVGDAFRSNISTVSFLLSRGINVAMVYGDRDYRCNWLGGEAVSLAAEWPQANAFKSAGYANLNTNSSYNGGYVRQVGGFSFSRIFQAGHTVGSFQPETAYRVFERANGGKDVATGQIDADSSAKGSSYKSKGPLVVRNVTETLPPEPALDCDIWDMPGRCSANQQQALADGTAVLRGGKVLSPAT